MDLGWLSSQIVIGVVVVVLVVGGLAFFALVEPRRAAPTDAADVAAAGTHALGHGQDAGEAGGPGVPGGGEEGGYSGGGEAAASSVFETEPCWQSLMKGTSAPADAAAGDAAAARADVDVAPILPDRTGEGTTPAASPGEDAATPG